MTAGTVVIHIKGVVEDRSFPGSPGGVAGAALGIEVVGRFLADVAGDTVFGCIALVVETRRSPGATLCVAGDALPGEMVGWALRSVA